MFVLSGKLDQTIVINGNIFVMVVGIGNNQVRLGIEAPDSVGIVRQELLDRAGMNEKRVGLAITGAESEGGVR